MTLSGEKIFTMVAGPRDSFGIQSGRMCPCRCVRGPRLSAARHEVCQCMPRAPTATSGWVSGDQLLVTRLHVLTPSRMS